MNKSTKKSVIFALLPIAALLVGTIALFVLGNIFTYSVDDIDPEAPLAGLGAFFLTIGNAIIVLLIAAFDLLLTSVTVYALASYSRECANNAIEELTACGESIKLPKTLKIISLIEMILSSTAAIAVGIALIAIFAFM